MKATELINKINSEKEPTCEWISKDSSLFLTAFGCEKAFIVKDSVYKVVRLDIVNYGHKTSLFGEDVFDFLISWLNFEKQNNPKDKIEDMRPYKLLSKLKIKIELDGSDSE